MNLLPMMMSPPSNASTKMGKVDRWIVNYMTCAAVIFGVAYIFNYLRGSSIGETGGSVLLAGILAFKALLVPGSRTVNGRGTVLLVLLFVLMMFNILISWDLMMSAGRWLMWLLIVVSFARVTGASEGKWVQETIRRLPYMFIIIYLSIVSTFYFQTDGDSYAFARHLSGMYANLIVATGLFAATPRRKLLLVLFGLVGIYYSGAGGALFTIPIMFIPYILYSTTSAPVKGFAVATMLLLGGVFFFETQLFSDFLDIKLNEQVDGGFAYNGLERLERSKDFRLALVQYGLNLTKQNPFGTGLGPTYQSDVGSIFGVAHVHDGTLSMLIELGIPGFALLASLLLWIFASIVRSPWIAHQTKAFYFTYFFTIFGRSLSENYTLFDLGNFFNLVFLLFTVSLFLNQAVRARAPQPAPMRPPYPAHPQWGGPPRAAAPGQMIAGRR